MSNDDTTSDVRYGNLRKIYTLLSKSGLYKDGKIIDYDEIIKNIYYLNHLIFKSYEIFKQDISDHEKADLIHDLRDVNGDILFNKEVAMFIVRRYNDIILHFYDDIYNKMILSQEGGYTGEDLYENNKITDFFNTQLQESKTRLSNSGVYKKYKTGADIIKGLYPSSTIRKLQSLFGIEDFYSIVNQLEKILGIDRIRKNPELVSLLVDAGKLGLIKGPKIIYLTSMYIFNWIFFPLYQLENLPVIGTFFEIPLDIIGVLIDNVDVVTEQLSFIIPLGLDLVTDVGSAVPGLGTAVAAASVPLAILEEPLEYFLANGADILGLFFNIERKEFGLAYLSAMEVFPALPEMTDMMVTNLYVANKWLDKGISFSDFIGDFLKTTNILSSPFLQDPFIMFKPKYVWDEVIYPNKDIIPIVRSIPFKTIRNIKNAAKRIKNLV